MSSFETVSSAPLYEQFEDGEYYKSFIRNNVRPDGRLLTEYRLLSIKSSVVGAPNVYGSAQVQLGKTIVMCGINIMVGAPSMADPDKGDLDCDITLSPLCDVKYDQRNKHPDATNAESAVLDAITLGNLFDLRQLCIVQGKYCYRLCINIVCLSNGGNITDASILAALFAIKDLKLPEPIVKKDIVEVNPDKFTRLEVNLNCLPVTVGIVDVTTFIVDPNQEEEKLLQGKVISVIDTTDGSLRYLKQNDHNGWSVNQIKEVVALSTKVALSNSAILHK